MKMCKFRLFYFRNTMFLENDISTGKFQDIWYLRTVKNTEIPLFHAVLIPQKEQNPDFQASKTLHRSLMTLSKSN